ncbi:MAG: hypothetical protein HZC24_01360, partial [Rhodocyclales bacterium]|nr:hypothetical protein [Rhodocyclales bacterium]
MRALGSLPRQLSRLGWPGALAASLAVCGAGLFLSLLQPARERLDGLGGEALARQEQLQRSDSPAEEGDTPASQLARFHQAFPALATLPEVLDRMFAVARRQGVALE